MIFYRLSTIFLKFKLEYRKCSKKLCNVRKRGKSGEIRLKRAKNWHNFFCAKLCKVVQKLCQSCAKSFLSTNLLKEVINLVISVLKVTFYFRLNQYTTSSSFAVQVIMGIVIVTCNVLILCL